MHHDLSCSILANVIYCQDSGTPYSTPLPFAGVAFLKTSAKGKTAMREVKTLLE
jgi:hypothetical protein